MTVSGILKFLDEKNLRAWLSSYLQPARQPKVVAIIMAGNVPAVGFHDALCVLLNGDSALIKLSSKDTILMKFLLEQLIEINPRFSSTVMFRHLMGFEDVIWSIQDTFGLPLSSYLHSEIGTQFYKGFQEYVD